METFIFKRYRIVRIDTMNGKRTFLWSYDHEDDAKACLNDYQNDPDKLSFHSYEMVDSGVPYVEIELLDIPRSILAKFEEKK